MLDRLEAYLAEWTGKKQWPSTKGRVESLISIPDGQIRYARLSRYYVLTYEVEGEIYTASVREISGQKSRPRHKGGQVTIQYDPDNPRRYYFFPACKLAGRFVAGLVLLAGLLAIFFGIRLAH